MHKVTQPGTNRRYLTECLVSVYLPYQTITLESFVIQQQTNSEKVTTLIMSPHLLGGVELITLALKKIEEAHLAHDWCKNALFNPICDLCPVDLVPTLNEKLTEGNKNNNNEKETNKKRMMMITP